MPIKSATSYQAEKKIIRRSLTIHSFLDFATVYSYFNVKICYFIVGNKIFCVFKKWVFGFLDEGTFQGQGEGWVWWVKFSKILRGIAHKGEEGGRGLKDLKFWRAA